MNGISKYFRPGSEGRVWVGATLVVSGLVGLAIATSTVDKAATACLAYAVIASFFLAAQVAGFIASQTRYSESIEQAKFDLLIKEEEEWAPRG